MYLISLNVSMGQENLSYIDESDPVGVSKVYQDSLNAKLLKDIDNRPVAQYLVAPSLTPEYILILEKEGNDFFLTYRILNQNYWLSKRREKITVETIRKQVDAMHAIGLRRLFEASMKNKTRDDRPGHDGTTYYFLVLTDKETTERAKVWSPRKGTRTKKLTEICEKYIAVFRTKKEFPAELLTEMEELLATYK